MSDQRAAAHTRCEKDDFFGDDLHSNSCRCGGEGGGDLFSRWVVPFLSARVAWTTRGSEKQCHQKHRRRAVFLR